MEYWEIGKKSKNLEERKDLPKMINFSCLKEIYNIPSRLRSILTRVEAETPCSSAY